MGDLSFNFSASQFPNNEQFPSIIGRTIAEAQPPEGGRGGEGKPGAGGVLAGRKAGALAWELGQSAPSQRGLF